MFIFDEHYHYNIIDVIDDDLGSPTCCTVDIGYGGPGSIPSRTNLRRELF